MPVKVTGIKGRELQCDFIHRLNKKKKFNKGDKKDDDDTHPEEEEVADK